MAIGKLSKRMGRALRWQANRALWHLRAASLPGLAQGKAMLHVGCGHIDAPGYINIDARPLPHVHFVVRDLRDLSFVPPGSLDLVYMCHVLEHVPHPEVASVLRAVQPTLRPGGTLRIAVPDFDRIVDIYRASGGVVDAIQAPLMGGQDYPENTHFVAFNADSLQALMRRCGFVDVRPWDAAQVANHDFIDTSNSPYLFNGQPFPISLNLEATRA